MADNDVVLIIEDDDELENDYIVSENDQIVSGNDQIASEDDNSVLEEDNSILEEDNSVLEEDSSVLEEDNSVLEEDILEEDNFDDLVPDLIETTPTTINQAHPVEASQLTQRVHKLEQSRRVLLDQLTTLQERCLYCEHELIETTSKLTSLQNKYDNDTQILKGQLIEAESLKQSLETDNRHLKSKIQTLEMLQSLKTEEVNTIEKKCLQKMDTLRQRIQESDNVELKLMRAERKIKQLEQKIQEGEDNQRLVTISKKQLLEYQSLVDSKRQTEQENNVLRQRVDNVELLTYQLHTLREKCEKLENVEKEYYQLQTDNKILAERLDSLLGEEKVTVMSPSVLRLQIVQLQQKEVILTSHCGTLETQVKILQSELDKARDQKISLQHQLSRYEIELQSKRDNIQRLERRVQFISKEREGCVHVLNSYKLESGANSILKELITELEINETRLKERIRELELEVERCHQIIEQQKKEVVNYQTI